MAPKFTLYRVENVITEESASHGDYASSEASKTVPATLREVIDALNSDFWDNVDVSGDGTIICYPADYVQDMRTGEYVSETLIINSRKPEWAEKAVDIWRAINRKRKY